MAKRVTNADIQSQLAVTHNTVLDMHHRLFGNGQPGEIEKLNTRISSTNDRVGKLENWRWYLLGAVAAVSTTIGLSLAIAKFLQ